MWSAALTTTFILGKSEIVWALSVYICKRPHIKMEVRLKGDTSIF